MAKDNAELLPLLRTIGEAGLRERANELAPRLVAMAMAACANGHLADSRNERELIHETGQELSRYQAKSFVSMWPIRFSCEFDPIYPIFILGQSPHQNEVGSVESRESGGFYRISWPVWRQFGYKLAPGDQETIDLLRSRQCIDNDLGCYRAAKERLEKLGINPETGSVYENGA